MKKLTKQALFTTALLGTIATNSFAEINAYSFDETTNGATLHKEFKKGDFNPYWFQEQPTQSYAYEASSSNTVYHREFKEGDFNPYWFQEDENIKITKVILPQ